MFETRRQTFDEPTQPPPTRALTVRLYRKPRRRDVGPRQELLRSSFCLPNLRHLCDRIQFHRSERIAFRPLAVADSGPLWQACQNPLFNEHLLWTKPETEQELTARVQALLDEIRTGQLTAVSAVLRDTGEWVALFRFYPLADLPGHGMETGIWTHPKFWAGGYSQELSRLAVRAAFRETAIDWVVAKTAEENKAAQRMIESVGLTLVAREQVPTESGAVKHARVYQITREQSATASWLA